MNDEMNLENRWNSTTASQAAARALRSMKEKQAERAAQEQLERIEARLGDVLEAPTTPQDDTSGRAAPLESMKSKTNAREVNAVIAVPLMFIAGLLGMVSLLAVVVGGGESIFELLGANDDPVAKALGQTREFDWTMHIVVFLGGLAVLALSAGVITYYLNRLEDQDRNR